MLDELNPLEYWYLLVRHKKTIGLIVACVTFIFIVVSLVLPKTYRAEATIVPIASKSGGISSMMAQLSGMSFLGALGAGADHSTKLMAILQSRTLAETIIKRFNLMQKVFFKKAWDSTKNDWENPNDPPSLELAIEMFRNKIISVGEDKKYGLIKVSVETPYSPLSAEVANGILEELQEFIHKNAFSVAKRNRIFVEKRLEESKVELLEVGKQLSSFYGDNLSSVDSLVNVDVSEVLSLNVPGVGLEKEIEVLAREKARLDSEMSERKMVKDVPQQVYLQYLVLKRELLAKITALLANQYEMSKIEEEKEDLSFEVIDYAVAPEKRHNPQRKRIVVTAFIFSLIFACFYVFLVDYVKKTKWSFKAPTS